MHLQKSEIVLCFCVPRTPAANMLGAALGGGPFLARAPTNVKLSSLPGC